MTKKELVEMLNTGPVRCKIDGSLRQITRNVEVVNMGNDINDVDITKGNITSLDKSSNIGVYDLGEAKITTITKDSVDSIIGSGLDT